MNAQRVTHREHENPSQRIEKFGNYNWEKQRTFTNRELRKGE